MSTTPRGDQFLRLPEGARRSGPKRPWLALAVTVVLVLYVLVFGDSGWLAVRSEEKAVAGLQQDIAATEARAAAVRAQTEALLRSGSDELERIAREEYRMRREGEEVHHLVGGGESGDAEHGPSADSEHRP